MQRHRKIIALCALFFLLLSLFSACGKQEPTAEALFRLRYIAQRTPLKINDNILFSCAAGENLYYTSSQTSQRTAADGSKFWVAVPSLYRIAPDGTVARLEPYSSYEAPLTAASSRTPQQLCAAPDGTLRLIVSQRDPLSGPAGGYRYSTWLLGLDGEGNVLFDTEIQRKDDLPASRWLQLCCDGGGRAYFQDQDGIQVFDPQGQPLGAITGSSARLSVARQTGEGLYMARLSDGRAASVSWSRSDTDWTLLVIDPEKLEFTTRIVLPRTEAVVYNGRFFPGTGDYDLMCATDLSLYGYKLDKDGTAGSGEQLLSWINCDMEGADVLAVTNSGEGDFLCFSANTYFGTERVTLSPGQPDNGETTILTLACRELPSQISQMVVQFNRQDNGCRIQIQDYGAVAVQSGLASGIDQLTVDLITGNGADLYCTDNMDIHTLIDQGLLEDLWPFIDSDEQLGGRDALVLPVFNALSQNGKLYEIMSSVLVYSALGASDVVGDTPGWTVEQFMQAAENLPNRRALIDPYIQSRSNMLEEVIAMCAESFIDRENWTAGFDSPEFAALLEYVAMFPEKEDWDADDARWLLDREQVIAEAYINNPISMKEERIRRLNGQPGTYIGFPGVAGNGSVFRVEAAMAMGSSSQHKQEAWAFLRTMLMPATQRAATGWAVGSDRGIPTNRTRFEVLISVFMKETEYGEETLDPDGNFVPLQPLTEEEAQAFRDLINGITVAKRTEESIAAIIRDEAARYFAGEQTAEAAAKAVQSRVNLYLGERKK